MTLSSPLRKAALAVHLTCSVGWIGAAGSYVALAVAAERSRDADTIRGAWSAMELIGWYVLVPAAVATVLTGVLLALGTRWGLLRHYWVLISLVLTVAATVVLLLHMPDVSALQADASRASASQLEAMGSDLGHSTLGLLLLLVIMVLNIYKPRGLTRRGWQLQQESSLRAARERNVAR